MRYFNNQDNQFRILNFINNSIDTLSYSVPFLPGEFNTAIRPGIFSKQLNAFEYAFNILIWNISKIFCN